jgi:hypothetical protein
LITLQLDIDGTFAIADVKYFFRLRFDDTVHSLALVSMFSPPDQEVLELSQHAAYICCYEDLAGFRVMDVKAITAVVSMVPDYEVTTEGDIIIPENRFSLVEAPFLKLATLCGTLGEDDDTIIDANE